MTTDVRKWAALQQRAHWECMSRNGRWGTCVACPRTSNQIFPEFCAYTERYDHQLKPKDLVEQFDRRLVEGQKLLEKNGYLP